MTTTPPNAPPAGGEEMERIYRCERCGLTCPANSQHGADDKHAYAATNCPGMGQMTLCAPTAAEVGDIVVELQNMLDVRPPNRTPYLQGLHGRAVVERAISALRAARRGEEATKTYVAQLRPVLESLVDHVWHLGVWNDHNWTDADYRKWRKEAQRLAPEALEMFTALAATQEGK